MRCFADLRNEPYPSPRHGTPFPAPGPRHACFVPEVARGRDKDAKASRDARYPAADAAQHLRLAKTSDGALEGCGGAWCAVRGAQDIVRDQVSRTVDDVRETEAHLAGIKGHSEGPVTDAGERDSCCGMQPEAKRGVPLARLTARAVTYSVGKSKMPALGRKGCDSGSASIGMWEIPGDGSNQISGGGSLGGPTAAICCATASDSTCGLWLARPNPRDRTWPT
ncbi:hypothetical protein QBC34DRAFT_422855 [Podospora aff. communis PSN243]|uniref:Uncharacterized protein n=1 Tax=Podospora aff. communis PSN243 TaxID=3040156 RepID=A0AAV9GY71_9PEZI|nr:hypothetical protein QBC34DRAFT_422855 [Podospora aff. communis PSN243]